MSFDDFKRSNLNYERRENRFKALNLPYIAASNFYTPGNIHCATINNIPVASFGGDVDITNVGSGQGVYQGQTGAGPFRFRSLSAGTASALSGSTTGITITTGTATTSDYITYTGTIAQATCKMNVSFATNNNTWRDWSLNLVVSGTSVTGSKSASLKVPASATLWRNSANIDVGGVAASGQVSATITWGDTRTITLLSGYIILQLS